MYVRTGNDYVSMSIYDFALKGKHNQYNTMAACVAACNDGDYERKRSGSRYKLFKVLNTEWNHVATVRGVEFINDSKATNVNSTWYALESMDKTNHPDTGWS